MNFFASPRFAQRQANNNFWRNDQTVFKWQQDPVPASTRTAAVDRLRNFKTLNLYPGARPATDCTTHSADANAPLTASDLTYTCPDGAFFNRFVTNSNSLTIRCCKLRPARTRRRVRGSDAVC